MKKLLLLLIAGVLLTACGTKKPNNKNSCSTLKVYSWGVYIGPNVKSDFEKKYNVRVIYDEFPSNEDMYTKLQGGESYDVIYPSDYMIERLIAEDYLQKIDKSLIPNFDRLLESVRDWDYDPGNQYSVPYFWGNVGLLYNTENVDEDDLEKQGYGIMANPKYSGRIIVYDSERDAFMMALKALGYSMNSSDEKEIEAAYQWLLKQKDTMRPLYQDDQSIDGMVAGSRDLALMYSGDAVYVMGENEDMAFYIPESGTNLWLDAMVIPKDSNCRDLAHKWINFQLEPDIARQNTLEVCYTTTVAEIYDEMIGEDGEFADISAYQVRTDNPRDEIFHYNAEIKKILADLWTRVHAH